MIAGWSILPFSDVVADETGGNIKTLQSEFLSEGAYPIVDQGKELVAGFTDDPARLCKAEMPAIIFGDHTKCLKFIDFPFCLGADGTKVLRPKIEIDLRYLFYYLQTVYIPDAGYSRHFKYLKKSDILLPPLQEQIRIAAVLDQADALRRLRQRALDKLNTLGQSIFREMFGSEDAEGIAQPLGELVEEFRYGTSNKANDAGYPALRIPNVIGGGLELSDLKTVPVTPAELARLALQSGDVLFV